MLRLGGGCQHRTLSKIEPQSGILLTPCLTPSVPGSFRRTQRPGGSFRCWEVTEGDPHPGMSPSKFLLCWFPLQKIHFPVLQKGLYIYSRYYGKQREVSHHPEITTDVSLSFLSPPLFLYHTRAHTHTHTHTTSNVFSYTKVFSHTSKVFSYVIKYSCTAQCFHGSVVGQR